MRGTAENSRKKNDWGFALVIIKGLWKRKNMCFVACPPDKYYADFFYNDTDDVTLAFAIN